jgi:hypothetical protein
MRSNIANFHADQAVDIAAENLLAKALRDLADGNRSRADAYIEKALRLPDSQQREGPAAQGAAHLMVFSAIVDEVEMADPGDSAWLDRALVVLDECGELAALDLKDALQSVASDYGLERARSKSESERRSARTTTRRRSLSSLRRAEPRCEKWFSNASMR